MAERNNVFLIFPIISVFIIMTSCYNSVVHMLTLMCAILWQIILVNPCLLSKYYIELVSTVLYHLTHVFQMMSQDKSILFSKNKSK